MNYKSLSSADRQWQTISILSSLASVDRIDIAIRQTSSGSFQNFLMLDICSAEIDAALSAARSRNAHDCDVYFRPSKGLPASIVMLDDVDVPTAKKLAARLAHMIIETSPGNCQLWLKTDQLLSEVERKSLQSWLIARHGGDVGSKSGEHYGRLAGFKNRKPKYKLPWVNVIQFDTDGLCIKVSELTQEKKVSPPRGACALAPQISPTPNKVLPNSLNASNGDSQESHREFKFACESLRKNVARESIISNITERALKRGKRNTAVSAEKYARKTVENAELAAFVRN